MCIRTQATRPEEAVNVKALVLAGKVRALVEHPDLVLVVWDQAEHLAWAGRQVLAVSASQCHQFCPVRQA